MDVDLSESTASQESVDAFGLTYTFAHQEIPARGPAGQTRWSRRAAQGRARPAVRRTMALSRRAVETMIVMERWQAWCWSPIATVGSSGPSCAAAGSAKEGRTFPIIDGIQTFVPRSSRRTALHLTDVSTSPEKGIGFGYSTARIRRAHGESRRHAGS